MLPKEIMPEQLNGIYQSIAEEFGTETALKFFNLYRGLQITFPMTLYSKNYIKRQIINEYTGSNIRELALKYNYTERWLYKILADENQSIFSKKSP